MDRRGFLPLIALAGVPSARPAVDSIRGRLARAEGDRPALDTPRQGMILLGGDKPTIGVLKDQRLAGSDFEALGQRRADGIFEVGPIHTRSMFLHRDGKRLYITYWCELCAIRTYTPGICWCCQQEMALDPREKDET